MGQAGRAGAAVTVMYLAASRIGKRRWDECLGKLPAPALLCSYIYFRDNRPWLLGERGHVREWVLDSGAFTAKQAGTEIRVEDYIEFCLSLRRTPRPPAVVFALDVIGDWEASLRNTEAMWKAGVQAVPCWHAGEPEEALVEMCRQYPRIAVGGTVGLSTKTRLRLFDAVFAKVWPKRIHGFGVHSEDLLMRYPFDSADSSSWTAGQQYGRWKSMPGLTTEWLRTGHRFRPEVEYWLNVEKRLEARWKCQMAQVRGEG